MSPKNALAILALLGAFLLLIFVQVGDSYNLFRLVAAKALFHHVKVSLTRPGAQRIVFFGDSLTAGMGAGFLQDFPTLLTLLYDRPSSNQGVPGDTTDEILRRIRDRPKINGPEFVVIWAGRNNYSVEQTPRDIAAMVAALNPGSRYLVLGVTNADLEGERKGQKQYAEIVEINAILKKTYGSRYVPARENLVARGNPQNPQDVRDMEDDIPPSSLRSDPVHFNNAGQVILATSVQDALVANGW
jgi:lysophospholipase L1-like esterase